jgi:hypothetical protein
LLEAQRILGDAQPPEDTSADHPDSAPVNVMRAVARRLYDLLSQGQPNDALPNSPAPPAVVLRAGKLGSHAIWATGEAGTPAYWRETGQEQGRVRDTTGGGNAFLGGLCAGLVLCNGDVGRGE